MTRILSGALVVTVTVAATPAASGKRKGKARFKPVTNATVVRQDAIRFRIHGLQSNDGWVVCRLYNKKGWLKDAQVTTVGPIARRAAQCVFEGVPPGSYGIAAFHDENKNGEPDTNGVGQPGEGVCISGRVAEITEKPPFKKAKFTFNGGVLTKAARMRYLDPPPE